MLLDRADQAITTTELQKNARQVLDKVADGTQDRYVVMRDGRPTAVLLGVERYEALFAELASLRQQVRTRFQGSLADGYRAMAADKEREAGALQWSNALIADGANEAW